jgi:hypothetical protein
MTNKEKLILAFILLIGFLLRFFNLNWDQGFHLHPDERMIIMVAEKVRLPAGLDLKTLFSPESPLNPRFFAYGNLPIYLLKIAAYLVSLAAGNKWLHYDHLTLVGRALSVFLDTGSIWLLFALSRRVFGKKTALLTSGAYATCVLPIQLAHFYAVDTALNFFILATLLSLVTFYERPTLKRAMIVGIAFGLALATKVSATVLVASIGTALGVNFVLLFLKKIRQERASWWQKIFLILKKTNKKAFGKRILNEIFVLGAVIVFFTFLIFLISSPYAIIDFENFWQQITAQRQMTKDAFVFPYTLQYVGTPKYLYHLKNMVSWGMGIGLGLLALVGAIWYVLDLSKRLFEKGGWEQEAKEMIVLSFFSVYFLIIGAFAVKFMRYLLPLYPIFILYGVRLGLKASQKKFFFPVLTALFLSLHFGWLAAFLKIYSRPHSRVEASLWINQSVPAGSTLAVEHWDDRLPLMGAGRYRFVEMPMYEPDNLPSKWQKVGANLLTADYLILASNRLHVPLQKLTDCDLPRCYPKTAEYYQALFAGETGFEKIKEFSSYPELEIGSWKLEINDSPADESFTVYDHPQVIIFKKIGV